MLHFLELTTYMLLQSLLMIFFLFSIYLQIILSWFQLITQLVEKMSENRGNCLPEWIWEQGRVFTCLLMSNQIIKKTKDIYFKAKKGWKQQLCCLCLLVGLSAALLKNYRTDFLETWTEGQNRHELLMWIQMKGQTFSLLFLNLTAAANHGAHTFQDDHYF